MDLTLLQGALSSLKIAGDIAKGFLDMKNTSEVAGKVAQLQSAILDAQSSLFQSHAAQSSLIDEVRDLKEEIVRLKTWETEKQRYKMVEAWTSAVTYALKESMKCGEPPHYICASCYQVGRKSILNPKHDAANFVSFACPSCKAAIPTGYRGKPTAKYALD